MKNNKEISDLKKEIFNLKIMKKNDVLKTVPIYSKNEIEKLNFIKSVFTSLNYMIWGDV